MTGLSPRDVVRILRADPGACAEAFRVCAGTLRQRGAVTGLVKVDDMLIVNRGVPAVAELVDPAVTPR